MIFDQFQRYKTAQIMADRIRVFYDIETLKILEIGANSQFNLEEMLPNDDITYSDICLPENLDNKRKYIIADASDLNNISDNQFDYVVALDVFEHVIETKRTAFIKEVSRVARYGALICFPINTAGVNAAEANVNEYYKTLYRKDHIWLKEHSVNGLPFALQVGEIIDHTGYPYFIFEHGDLNLWQEMIKTQFCADYYQELTPLKMKMDDYYQKNLYYYDRSQKNYRTFIVITKEEKLRIFLSEAISNIFKEARSDEHLHILLDISQAVRDLRKKDENCNRFKVFLDLGHGFSEENKIVVVSKIDNENGNFSIRIKLPEGIQHIRFDPVEEKTCIIEGLQSETNNGIIYAVDNNGFALENYIIFSNRDPQLLFDLSDRKVEWIQFKGALYSSDSLFTLSFYDTVKRNLDTRYAESKALQQENEMLYKQLGNQNNESHDFNQILNSDLDAIINSASRKTTMVLRLLRYGGKVVMSRLHYLISKVKYHIDVCEYSNNTLSIKGWIFLADAEIQLLQMDITCGTKKYVFDILDRARRPDVYAQFKHENAMNSGFKSFLRIEDCSAFRVTLRYYTKSRKGFVRIGCFKSSVDQYAKSVPRISAIVSGSPTVELEGWIRKNTIGIVDYAKELYKEKIDIIVPVYNGYEYLDRLFNSIALTQMQYRLIIVNDHSPDERVWSYIQGRFMNNPDIVMINNDENLGFVKSVNKALAISRNHVVIVNTDTEMPQMWLERLMAPIILNQNIASSTPFTNAGTICSFPQIGSNNVLFEELQLSVIDEAFKNLRPTYCPLPTGVGFCMGMSKDALKSVGFFDADTFTKGYGEENDWCQRAINKGYKNVIVENLFVYHKHGGSFQSEEKRKLLDTNQKRLIEKHPDYLKDVACFFEVDSLKLLRNYVTMKLSFGLERKTILVFDHDLGGGATSYIEKRITQWLIEGHPVVTVRYNPESKNYLLYYMFRKYAFSYKIVSLDFLREFFADLDTIYINELVSYSDIYKTLEQIVALKSSTNARLVYLFHDYYALCPSYNLLNNKLTYCRLDQTDSCEICISTNNLVDSIEVISRKKWTEHWGRFLLECDDIVVFSQSSAKMVSMVYGDALKVLIQPHRIENIMQINKNYKTTATLNIGLLGVLTYHKGANIVRQMLDVIAQEGVRAKVILVGSTDENLTADPNFIATGKYSIEMLPNLVYQYDIDLFFISSIWPETFSYTTEEIIKSNMPVVSFNLGAPAERIRNYSKGKLIEKIDAEIALRAIQSFSQEICVPISPFINDKILFVTEYTSFSSRYRIEHLQEQLMIKGVASDFIQVEDLHKYDIREYKSLYIYRCTYSDKLKAVVNTAKENQVRVLYDIDDFLFDYEQTKDLEFLIQGDYADYKQYSLQLRSCMKLCDAFVTSTINLKERIENMFWGKHAYVNRNVASMEMVMLSQKAVNLIRKDANKVVLGYFSGTSTHDNDFQLIKDVLLDLMEKYSYLHIKLGGILKIDPEFSQYSDRIITQEFINWKLLPDAIAAIDINLMPLKDSVFHECKSENKWTEAALVKVPTIASHNSELMRVIDNGVTGYLCKTDEEWRDVLEKMIVNIELREQIGSAANKKVMIDYTTANLAPEMMELVLNQDTLNLEI